MDGKYLTIFAPLFALFCMQVPIATCRGMIQVIRDVLSGRVTSVQFIGFALQTESPYFASATNMVHPRWDG